MMGVSIVIEMRDARRVFSYSEYCCCVGGATLCILGNPFSDGTSRREASVVD